MKRLIYFTIFFTFHFTCFSQNQLVEGNLTVSGDVNVQSPGSKIGYNTSDTFTAYSRSNAHYGITYNGTQTPLALSGYYGLGFFTSGIERMIIDVNGNMGIGTVSPLAKLDVGTFLDNGFLGTVFGRLAEGNGTGNGTFLGVRGYTTSPNFSKSFAIEHNFFGQTNNSINFFRGGDVTGGFITFNTNDNSEKMRIDFDGKVGIGTNQPQAKLHVIGDIISSNRIIANNELVVSQNNIDIGGAITLENPAKTANGQARKWTIFNMGGAYGNSLQFWAYDNLGCSQGGLCAPRFTIRDNGYVGIGTNNPQYTLNVKGKIRGTEIRVEPTSAFPDFVFEKDYNLRSIDEVQNFINKNGHLPEIPTALEVKENGIDVAEMQIKLLQKIEELTLYIIQQQRKIEKLEKDLNK